MQTLTLLQRSDKTRPSVYKFGANERLVICKDNQAHLCGKDGAYVRNLGWHAVKDMGYDPIKLLRGEREDQFLTQNK